MRERRFIVDATILQQENTGVAKYTIRLFSGLEKKTNTKIIWFNSKCVLPFYLQNSITVKIYNLISRHFVLVIYSILARKSIFFFPYNGGIPKMFSTRHLIISTIHDLIPLEIDNYFNESAKKQKFIQNVLNDIDRSDIILTDSIYSKQRIQELYSNNKTFVIYLDTTLDDTKEDPSILEKHNLINNEYYLYYGGYHPRKQIEELVKAHKLQYKESKSPRKLVLAGKPYYYSKNLKNLIEQCQSENILVETGYINDEELKVLIKNSVLLVYPSLFEGFGLPPVECMKLGCPVLATRVTSLKEICGESTFLISDPKNIESFSREIIEALKNNQLRNEIISKAYEHSKKFSWETSIKQLAQLITNHPKYV